MRVCAVLLRLDKESDYSHAERKIKNNSLLRRITVSYAND